MEAKWYVDPDDEGRGRYFDGTRWTEHTIGIPAGETLPRAVTSPATEPIAEPAIATVPDAAADPSVGASPFAPAGDGGGGPVFSPGPAPQAAAPRPAFAGVGGADAATIVPNGATHNGAAAMAPPAPTAPPTPSTPSGAPIFGAPPPPAPAGGPFSAPPPPAPPPAAPPTATPAPPTAAPPPTGAPLAGPPPMPGVPPPSTSGAKPPRAPKAPKPEKAPKPPKAEKAPKAEKPPKPAREPRAARSKVTKLAPITASGGRPGAAPPAPKSRLKPLLAALAVVVIGAGAFLFLTKGDDAETPAEVAGTTVERQSSTSLDPAASPTTTVADPASSAAPTTVVPTPVTALTPTQQRELCHVAISGQLEGAVDTGDPVETCTTDDFVAVSIEVGVFLRADPATDYRANLVQQCATARAVGRNPLACQGIPTS